jgi:hypothetical protein
LPSFKDEHWHLPFNLTLAEKTMEEQLVDVPVAQQASPPRVELPIPVEVSSSSGTQSPSVEAMNSPEMSLPIQPELSSPPRAQSPTGHEEAPTLAEVNSSSLQPEAPELPVTAATPSHSEASVLPGTSPSPVIAPEQSPAPAHEVLIRTQLCYFYF